MQLKLHCTRKIQYSFDVSNAWKACFSNIKHKNIQFPFFYSNNFSHHRRIVFFSFAIQISKAWNETSEIYDKCLFCSLIFHIQIFVFIALTLPPHNRDPIMFLPKKKNAASLNNWLRHQSQMTFLKPQEKSSLLS